MSSSSFGGLTAGDDGVEDTEVRNRLYKSIDCARVHMCFGLKALKKALFHNPVRSDRHDLAVLTGAPCGALKVLFLKSFVVMQSRIFELRREDDYVCGARKVSWWPEWSATALGCSHQKTAASGYGLKAVATYCARFVCQHMRGETSELCCDFHPSPPDFQTIARTKQETTCQVASCFWFSVWWDAAWHNLCRLQTLIT